MTDHHTKNWTWHFDAEPMAIWAVLADTARFNEAAGFPKHDITERKEPDGSVSYVGKAVIAGLTVSWRDIPLEWVEGERFTHRNEFFGTPVKSLAVTLTLTPEENRTRRPGPKSDSGVPAIQGENSCMSMILPTPVCTLCCCRMMNMPEFAPKTYRQGPVKTEN